jgi:hypothetical protein
MNTTFFTGRRRLRQGHLGDDLGAAHLAQQAALAGHAEQATDGAADLGGHAQAVARQQHALHHLAVVQLHQQAHRTVGGRVLGAHPGQAFQFLTQLRQAIAHGQRQEVLGVLAAGAGVQRLALQPGAHHPATVGGQGAEVGEALVDVGDSHGARMLPLAVDTA